MQIRIKYIYWGGVNQTQPIMRNTTLPLILLLMSLFSMAYTQQIEGDTIACNGSYKYYTFPTVDSLNYTWQVGGGSIVQYQGDTVEVIWTTNVQGLITLTEKDSNYILNQYTFYVDLFPLPQPSIIPSFLSNCRELVITEGPNPDEQITSTDCYSVCDSTAMAFYAVGQPNSTFEWTVLGVFDTLFWTNDSIGLIWTQTGQGLVALTEITEQGCEQLISFCLEINERPNASFEINHPNVSNDTLRVCKEQEVQFFNTTLLDESIATTVWYLNGTQVAIGNNPLINFTEAGSYQLTMEVSNECNCKDTATAYIIVENHAAAQIECSGIKCEGDTGLYYVNANCSTYDFTVIGSTDYTIDSNRLTVTWNAVPANGYGQIIFDGSNCTGVCTQATVLYVPVITQNAAITGNTILCDNVDYVNYSIPFWPGTFYEWSIISQNGNATLFNEESAEVTLQINEATDSIILQVAYYNDLLNCGDTNTITIYIKDKLELTGPNVVCAGDSFSYTASPGTSLHPYEWYTYTLSTSTEHTGQTDSSFTYAINTAGDYFITVGNTDFCNVAGRNLLVVATPPPPMGINGADTICLGNYYTYTTQISHPDYYAEWMLIDGQDTIIDQGTEIGYQFNSSGPYQVRVRQYNVTNPNCHSEDIILNIYLEQPFAIEIAGKDTVCANSTDIYTSNLLDGENYSWTLSNSNIGSIFNANSGTVEIQWNNITSPTNVNLYLTAQSCGNIIRDTLSIHVNIGPEPNIVMTGNLCVGETINFAETGVGSGPYIWTTTGPSIILANYGNNIDIRYDAPGTHFVNVEIQNPDGCITTVEEVVSFYINPQPVARISIDSMDMDTVYCLENYDSLGVDDIFIRFVRTSQYNPNYTYQWMCNDMPMPGATNKDTLTVTNSNICIPTNVIDTAKFSLMVTDTTTGCTKLSNVISLIIDSCDTCIADISLNAQAERYCDSVYFSSNHDTLSPFYHSAVWDIGGGYTPYANQQNFGHRYHVSGIYWVSRRVNHYYNDGSSIIDSSRLCYKDTLFPVAIPAIPNFEYAFACDAGNNIQVSFIRTTDFVALYTTFQTPVWTIYDNSNILVYNGTTPPTTLASGTYTVTLTEVYSFNNGSIVITNDTCSTTKTVVVPQPAQAAFSFAPNPVCEGVPVHFTDNSTGDIISWLWEYGDGSSSLLPDSSVRTYEFEGNNLPYPDEYYVVLTITDKYGCTDNVMDIVSVNEDNFYQKIDGDSIACYGTEVELSSIIDIADPDYNATYATSPITYAWSTGDTTATTIVTESGTYAVHLTDQYGCREYAQFPVVFFNVPAATITGPSAVCSREDFTLEGPQHVGSLTYLWEHSTDNLTWDAFSTNAVYYGEGNEDAYSIGTPFTWTPYQTHYIRLIINTAIAGTLSCPDTSTVFVLEVREPLNTPQIGVSYDCTMPATLYFANLSDYTAPVYHWSTGQVNTDTVPATYTGLYAISLRDSFGCATRGLLDFEALPILNDLTCGCVEVCDTSLPTQVPTHITTDQDWWLLHNNAVIDSGYGTNNILLNVNNANGGGIYSLAIAGTYYGQHCIDTLEDFLNLTVLDCCPDSVWATLSFVEDTVCNNEIPFVEVDFNYNIYVGVPDLGYYQDLDSTAIDDGVLNCRDELGGNTAPIPVTHLSDTVLEIFVIPHNGDSLGNATCIGDTVWASVYFERCRGCDSLALIPQVDYYFSNGHLYIKDESTAPYGYHLVEMWYNGQYYSGAPQSTAQFTMENINTCDTVFYTISYFLDDICCTATCYEVICLDCEDIDMNIDVQSSLSGNTWFLTYSSSYQPTYLSWTFPDGTQQAGNVSTNPNIMYPNYEDHSGSGGQVCVISSIKLGVDTADCGTPYTQCCNVEYCFDLLSEYAFNCDTFKNMMWVESTMHDDSSSFTFTVNPNGFLYHSDVVVHNIDWDFGDGYWESGTYEPSHSYVCSPNGDTIYYGKLYLEVTVYHDGVATYCYESFKFEVVVPMCGGGAQAKIYPNPAKESIKIDFNGIDVSNTSYKVYNNTGKMLYGKERIHYAVEEINTTQWSRGIYTIVFKNGEKVYRKKFVKE